MADLPELIRTLPRFKAFLSLLILVIGAICTSAAYADSNPPPFSDAWMDIRYDWVIKVDSVTPKNYLQYSGSKLKPVLCLKTFVRMNPNNMQGQPQAYVPYENLWYGNGQPIGCRRLMASLPLQPRQRGVIYISQSDLINTQSPAFAHAITKLLLDTCLCNCTLVAVLVSEEYIGAITDGMKQCSFAPLGTVQDQSNPCPLSILLTSGTASKLTTTLFGPMSND